MVGGQNETTQDKSGHIWKRMAFLLLFAEDFKIESNMESPISRKEDWLKARFQESGIARFQYFKKEWKQENKIEIKQSFKIAIWKQRKLYGWIDWKQ